MIIVFETMVLVGYMINNYIGIALMLLLCVWERFYYAKKEGLYRASDKMILALPMAYIGIAGTSMHHMLSWYNLFLVAFIVKIAQYYSFKIPFKKSRTLHAYRQAVQGQGGYRTPSLRKATEAVKGYF